MSCPGGSQVNLALMQLVGFNARQVQAGLTKRGDAQRKTKKKQGPLTPPCLADHISKLTATQMETCFNQMVESRGGMGTARWGTHRGVGWQQIADPRDL